MLSGHGIFDDISGLVRNRKHTDIGRICDHSNAFFDDFSMIECVDTSGRIDRKDKASHPYAFEDAL